MAEQEVPGGLSGRLGRFLEEYPARPFSWEDHHCVGFVAAWVLEETGVDHMSGWTPIPGATARSSYRAIRRLAESLPALVSKHLCTLPQGAAFAQLGDVVFLPSGNERGALGICAGRSSAFLNHAGGIIYRPTLDATLSWRLTRDQV